MSRGYDEEREFKSTDGRSELSVLGGQLGVQLLLNEDEKGRGGKRSGVSGGSRKDMGLSSSLTRTLASSCGGSREGEILGASWEERAVGP